MELSLLVFQFLLKGKSHLSGFRIGPFSESDLMQLLEHKISAVSGKKDGTLTLVFDDGQILKCYDQLPNYDVSNQAL
jgi:hypothetical protein